MPFIHSNGLSFVNQWFSIVTCKCYTSYKYTMYVDLMCFFSTMNKPAGNVYNTGLDSCVCVMSHIFFNKMTKIPR